MAATTEAAAQATWLRGCAAARRPIGQCKAPWLRGCKSIWLCRGTAAWLHGATLCEAMVARRNGAHTGARGGQSAGAHKHNGAHTQKGARARGHKGAHREQKGA